MTDKNFESLRQAHPTFTYRAYHWEKREDCLQLQFDFEVNGHEWTEKQKLEHTYETNSLRLVAEGKLSEEQRKIALDITLISLKKKMKKNPWCNLI